MYGYSKQSYRLKYNTKILSNWISKSFTFYIQIVSKYEKNNNIHSNVWNKRHFIKHSKQKNDKSAVSPVHTVSIKKQQQKKTETEMKIWYGIKSVHVYVCNDTVVPEVLRRPNIATLIVQHLQQSHWVVIRYAHDRMSVEVFCCCTGEVFPFVELSVYRYVILTQRIIVSTTKLYCSVPAD